MNNINASKTLAKRKAVKIKKENKEQKEKRKEKSEIRANKRSVHFMQQD